MSVSVFAYELHDSVTMCMGRWVTGMVLPELENHMRVHDSGLLRAVDAHVRRLVGVIVCIVSPLAH